MLDKGYLVSQNINKHNREQYLKAFIIAGAYDVKRLEIIFSRSTKTMYKDMKKQKDMLLSEVESKNNTLTYSDLQQYINYVYDTIYSSISFLSIAERRKLVKEIIHNLERNFNASFIDDDPVKLKELSIEIGVREKTIYLNQFYNQQSNYIFFNHHRIKKFTKQLIDVMKEHYSLMRIDILLTDLEGKVIESWLGYRYNILENRRGKEISNHPQVSILIKSFFKENLLNINDYEVSKLSEIIVKHIKFDYMKVNILAENKEIMELTKRQLSLKFKDIKFTSYNECDIQVIPKDLEIDKVKIETNLIFNDNDLKKLKEFLREK
ncbi:MAG: hypothetical protein ACK5K7_00015 [Bacilli bacterium]